MAPIILIDTENTLGRVDLNIVNETIWVSSLRTNGDDAELLVNAYDLQGKFLEDYVLPGLSKKRSGGFPQITEYGDGLLVSYTDVSKEVPFIRSYVME
ncbi:MAG: hypothetical protein U5K71_07450 [Gracilimonas sp.]|nr:hypothetical protein [Gracilimonas sp.]